MSSKYGAWTPTSTFKKGLCANSRNIKRFGWIWNLTKPLQKYLVRGHYEIVVWLIVNAPSRWLSGLPWPSAHAENRAFVWTVCYQVYIVYLAGGQEQGRKTHSDIVKITVRLWGQEFQSVSLLKVWRKLRCKVHADFPHCLSRHSSVMRSVVSWFRSLGKPFDLKGS